jgi:hypothetical protein
MECIKVFKGKYLSLDRTIDRGNGEIFDHVMIQTEDPGFEPPKVQCWTCLNLEDNILRDGLFPGMSVRVKGLLNAAVYNGQKGVVVKMMDDNRVAIKLPQPAGPPKELSVKRENLLLADLETSLAELEELTSDRTSAHVSVEDSVMSAVIDALRDRIRVRNTAVTKTYLVCWPLPQVDKLKVRDMFSSRKFDSSTTLEADILFSDSLRFRLALTVEQIDNDKRENIASMKLTSLQKDQPLNSINGPVMLCTCAQLGRAAGSSDASTLSVMCPSFTNAVGRRTRVATSCWVDSGIGDSRSIAMFPHGSLGNQHYPTRHEIAALCNHLSIQGHLPAAPIEQGGGGEVAVDDRFFAVVVKITELQGRRVESPDSFEQVVFGVEGSGVRDVSDEQVGSDLIG